MKFQTILKAGLLIIIGFSIAILCIAPLRSQIQSIAGLAVAQTPIRWNNVKDAAVGDAQINGLLATGPYLYDPVGAQWNRMRGTAGGALSISLPSTGLLALLTAVAAPTVGGTNDISATFPSKMTWEIVVTGVLASQNTNLEGSINGTTWYVLDNSATIASEMRHVVNKPIQYVRANCTAVGAGGGTVTVRFIGGGN